MSFFIPNKPQIFPIPKTAVHYGNQPFRRLFVAGCFGSVGNVAALTTGAQFANRIVCIPFMLPQAGTISGFSLSFLSVLAASFMHFGIYKSNINPKIQYPTDAVFLSPDYDVSAGGSFTSAVNFSLLANVQYWLCSQWSKAPSVAGTIFQQFRAPTMFNIFGIDPAGLGAAIGVKGELAIDGLLFANGLPNTLPLTGVPSTFTDVPGFQFVID